MPKKTPTRAPDVRPIDSGQPPFVAPIDPETDGKRPVSARLLVYVLAGIVSIASTAGGFVVDRSIDKVGADVKGVAKDLGRVSKNQVALCRQINELGAAIDAANSHGGGPAISIQERQRACDALGLEAPTDAP
jgi:hypothetical protein